MNKIMVVGSNGFIGRSICKFLVNHGVEVIGAARELPRDNLAGVEHIATGNFEEFQQWSDLLQRCSGVIFSAGLAHDGKGAIPKDTVVHSNMTIPVMLAKKAIKYNVKKLIFLSSIKVNGNFTKELEPFKLDSIPKPNDNYSKSKLHAELMLNRLVSDSTEIAIIRIPLVIGKNAKGNVATLQKLIRLRVSYSSSKSNF